MNFKIIFEDKKIYKPGCVGETFIHTQVNVLCGKKTRMSSQKCKAYNKINRKNAFWKIIKWETQLLSTVTISIEKSKSLKLSNLSGREFPSKAK